MFRPCALFFSLFACAVFAADQTINVENFNNPGATGAVILNSSWTNNVTRTSETIVVAGNARDDNGWGATNQSLNATGMNFVTIFAQRDAGNSAPSIVLSFEDTQLRTHQVSVGTSSFQVGSITAVQLPIGAWPSNFNPAQITGWNIGGGTPPPGVVPFRMTFDHLTLSSTAVLSAPTITEQPADRVIGAGTGTTLTVAATGTPPLRYQWKRNATVIDGATNATLAFTNTPVSAAGSYQVDVSNDSGITPSRVATVTVLDAQATHALAGTSTGGFVPGGTVTVTNTITFTGAAPASLGWRVLLPTGWSFASDGGTAPQTKPTVGAANGLAEWTWTTVPASPVTFTYTLNVPATAAGAQSLTGQLLITQGGATAAIFAKADPLPVPAAILPHSADTNGDYKIGLVELTRVIELYNVRIGTTRTGAYVADPSNVEDGFATAPTRTGGATVSLTRYHSADADKNAYIGLIELTRVIELFNYRVGTNRTGDYHIQSGTEDGFAPGL